MARARRAAGSAAADGSDRRPAARGRLPALRAAARRVGRISEHGGKAILLNRRGLAPAIHRRACGVSRRCGLCDVSLTLHTDARLHCHHCGFSEAVPEACPARVVRARADRRRHATARGRARRRVPELERIRLDADTAAKRGALQEALERFARPTAPSSSAPRWSARATTSRASRSRRSSTRTPGSRCPTSAPRNGPFEARNPARRSERARCARKGDRAELQPDATPLRYAAARHDVAGFLVEELERRRELGYPPFRHLLSIVASGPDAVAPERLLRELNRGLGGDLLGPAPLLRLGRDDRAQLVAKTDRPRSIAARAAQLLAAAAPAMRRAGVTAVVDVDPQSL